MGIENSPLIECAASVELPIGSNRTFFPVACSKVRVTGILLFVNQAVISKQDTKELTCHLP